MMDADVLVQEEVPAAAAAPVACANCGARLTGPYCAECGQKRAERLGFREVLSAVAAELSSLDTALLRTFVDLTRAPGRVAREYVQGRRTHYMNPLKYAFYAATVYVVVVHLAGVPLTTRGFEAGNETVRTVFSLLPYLMLLALLPAAALQRLLFRSRGDRVAECYAMGLYAYGHVSWFALPLVLGAAYGSQGGVFVVHGLRVLFFMWTTAGFYRSTSPSVLLRAFLVFVTFFFATFVLAMATSITLISISRMG